MEDVCVCVFWFFSAFFFFFSSILVSASCMFPLCEQHRALAGALCGFLPGDKNKATLERSESSLCCFSNLTREYSSALRLHLMPQSSCVCCKRAIILTRWQPAPCFQTDRRDNEWSGAAPSQSIADKTSSAVAPSQAIFIRPFHCTRSIFRFSHIRSHILIFLFKDFLDKLRDCEYVINGPFNTASLQHPASQHFGPRIEEYNTMKLDSIQVVNLRLTTTNFFLTLPV